MPTTRHLLTAMLVTAFALSACGSDDPVDTASGDTASGDTAPGAADPGDTETSEPDSEVSSGSQGGTVTIDGAEYTFGAVFACIFNDDFIVMQGPGTGPGGGPFWVDFDSSSSSDDDDVDGDGDGDGDGEPDSSVFINVRGGVTENELVTPLDQPDFYADNSGNFVGVEATFEITDNSVSGFGFMTDTNAITDAGELLPFEFEASCGDSDGTSNDDEQALDDMQDEVSSDDAAATVTDASGGGIVTVDGVAYAFGAEVCFFQESGFVIVGPGSDPDGNPAYVDVEGSSETDFDGDGKPDEEIMVGVEVGAIQMGSGTEDQPYFFVSAWGDITAEQITFERTDNSVSGSGFVVDNNAAAAEFDEPIPFEFEATCG